MGQMGLGHYEINEDMSQRLRIMKFIFMLCVVFIHSYALPDLANAPEVPWYVAECKDLIVNGICRVAVPGFFFISGLLLFSKEFTWFGNLKKKAKSIGIPYMLINSFWILFFVTVHSFEATAHYFADEAYQIGGGVDLIAAYLKPMPLYYPFWFLRDLMILNLAAGIIKTAVDRVPVLTAVLMVALQMNVISLPLLLNDDSFIMFALGGYFVKYRIDAAKLERVKMRYVGMLFAVLMLMKLYLGKGQKFVFPVFAVCGICFCYQLAGKVLVSKAAQSVLWCSQFTFFIFGFHEFYMAMAKRILMTLLPQSGMIQLLEFLMLPIVISAVCIAAGAVMRRTVPRLYGIVCGSR